MNGANRHRAASTIVARFGSQTGPFEQIHMRSFTEYSHSDAQANLIHRGPFPDGVAFLRREILEWVTLVMTHAFNGTIHIVDDDPTVRDSLALLLAFLGYQTRAWPSGGLFLAEQPIGQRDIIFVDMIMPGEDGLAVIRTLREKKLFNPVILMTGDASPVLKNRTTATYCTVLPKPFSKDALQNAINMAASGEP